MKNYINTSDEMFKPILNTLDNHIKKALIQINSENFDEATITLKLKLSVTEKDTFVGENVISYKEPKITFDTNTKLSHNYQDAYRLTFKDCELVKIGNEFGIVKVKDNQLNMLDE
ncbi:hypothetical protein ABGF49_07820 [Helcococcus ovis]|uniref:hypothetical protein n=1 Tax=Helcococcus TaxID=31983 RepID=UPI0038B82BDE